MDLVDLILSKYSSCLQVKVEEIVSLELIRASAKDNLLKVLKNMSLNQIFALPIIQDDKLVGTISLSDFKDVIFQGNLEELSLSFFVKPEYVARGVCLKTDTLETALLKIKSGHIHRLWVLEGDEPKGVVSISDICRFISNFEIESRLF